MIKKIKYFSDELKLFLQENKIVINMEDPFSKNILYIDNNMIIGFLNYSIMYERAELNYIFVLETYRNKKVATKLLNEMIKNCESCDNITLEVRKSNSVALKLYTNYGFKEVAIRKNYYNNEDGILMMLVVK